MWSRMVMMFTRNENDGSDALDKNIIDREFLNQSGIKIWGEGGRGHILWYSLGFIIGALPTTDLLQGGSERGPASPASEGDEEQEDQEWAR